MKKEQHPSEIVQKVFRTICNVAMIDEQREEHGDLLGSIIAQVQTMYLECPEEHKGGFIHQMVESALDQFEPEIIKLNKKYANE